MFSVDCQRAQLNGTSAAVGNHGKRPIIDWLAGVDVSEHRNHGTTPVPEYVADLHSLCYK